MEEGESFGEKEGKKGGEPFYTREFREITKNVLGALCS